MAKFISIPTNVPGQPALLFNTDNISSVVPPATSTTTTCAVISQGKTFTLTFGGSTTTIQGTNALAASNLINNAVTTGSPQPVVANVVFPSIRMTSGAGASTGVTVTVDSTTGLVVGMCVTLVSGTGAFAANTTVASIISSTQFTVNASGITTTLSGAVISAGVLSINTIAVG